MTLVRTEYDFNDLVEEEKQKNQYDQQDSQNLKTHFLLREFITANRAHPGIFINFHGA